MFEHDDQFSKQIAEIFRKLRHYTLHLHNDHDLTERYHDYEDKKTWRFPPLETLRILNARCETLGLEKNIRLSFLAPSTSTLRYFELQTPSEIPFDHTLFGKHTFPSLETLIKPFRRISSLRLLLPIPKPPLSYSTCRRCCSSR